MQREEPYLPLTLTESGGDTGVLRPGKQVLHGCRQLVS